MRGSPTATPPQRRGSRGAGGASLPIAVCAAAENGAPTLGAVCSEIALVEGKAPEWVQLFPRGPEISTVAGDGRHWRLADPEAIARRTDELRGGLDLAIDWEHSQDRKAPRGERSDAAAWIKEVAVRDGLLVARVEWTEEGRRSVESRSYRYLSPAFGHTKRISAASRDGGDVVEITGAGLVNRPAFNMPALAGREDNSMLEKILKALGLAADAGVEAALSAVASLKSERDTAVARAGSPSLDEWVPRADYDKAVARSDAAEAKLAESQAATRDAEIERLLDEAQTAGKITPATREYHKSQCQADGGIERFKAYVGCAPEIAGAGGGSASPPGSGTGRYRSSEEAAIARRLGRDAKFLDEHAPVEVN